MIVSAVVRVGHWQFWWLFGASGEIGMRIWKASLTSRADGMTPELIERARALCFSERVVGIGWGLDEQGMRRPTCPEDYALQAQAVYDDNSWRRPHGLFLRPSSQDLVWTRSKISGFWVGRFLDDEDWTYKANAPFAELDLWQVRSCEWVNVGRHGDVPGTVRNAFSSPKQMAFCQLHQSADITAYLSAIAYIEYGGGGLERPPTPASLAATSIEYLLASIPHDELEDLVGLYLQAKLGWMVISSTCKKNTATTEFEMVDRDGRVAHLQVKGGTAALAGLGPIDLSLDAFYVFQASAPVVPEIRAMERLCVVEPAELWHWACRNRKLIPRTIRHLLDLV